jgi:hypothetical protein
MATMVPLWRPQNCTIMLEPDPHWPMEATSRAFQRRRYALLALRAPPNTAALQTKKGFGIAPHPHPPTQPTIYSRSRTQRDTSINRCLTRQPDSPSLQGIQRHWADRQTDSRQPFRKESEKVGCIIWSYGGLYQSHHTHLCLLLLASGTSHSRTTALAVRSIPDLTFLPLPIYSFTLSHSSCFLLFPSHHL